MNAPKLQTHGFDVVRGLIDPAPYYKHMQDMFGRGEGDVDTFVPGARVFYQDALFEHLLAMMRPTIESHVGHRLLGTYSYAREYDEGHQLRPHKDRPSCEITVSISLGPRRDPPWPIWLLDFTGQPHAVELHPGDAVMYMGIEVVHWRQKNVYGPCSQLFLHYVDRDGPHSIYEGNTYKPIWFSRELFGRTVVLGIVPPYTCECGLLTKKRRKRGRAK